MNPTSTASTVDVGFNPPSSHTTTFTLTNPPIPNCGYPATPCPSPLQRDVGWFNLARRREGSRGTQEVEGPKGVLRKETRRSSYLVFAFFYLPKTTTYQLHPPPSSTFPHQFTTPAASTKLTPHAPQRRGQPKTDVGSSTTTWAAKDRRRKSRDGVGSRTPAYACPRRCRQVKAVVGSPTMAWALERRRMHVHDDVGSATRALGAPRRCGQPNRRRTQDVGRPTQA